MNILYNRETLAVEAVFNTVSEWTDKLHDTFGNVVRHPESLHLDDIHLEMENGQVVVKEKQHMGLSCVDFIEQIKVGSSIVIEGVPEGAEIRSNGEVLGTMDASGVLEFTPQTAGLYRLQFFKRGHHTEEHDVEALP